MRLHREIPGVIRARRDFVLGQALVHDAHQIAARTGGHALDRDVVGIVVRIGLGDFRKGNFALVQLLFEDFDGVVGVDLHRIVDLHLQDQVRPAAQIEAEVDALGHGREQTLSRKALWNAENTVQENDQRSYDEYRFV